jgi:hypothetical protein
MGTDENNVALIAYCGLYCGDCFGYTGRRADLVRDLREKLRKTMFERTAELISLFSFFDLFKNYKHCYEVLRTIVSLHCTKACKGGSGPPSCKIRECCRKKGIEGCWQCDAFETCEKLDFLKPFHGDAHLKNLRILKKQGVEKFLAGKKYW